MYRARLLNSFLKQEKKLNAEIKERVIEAVEGILSDPYSGVDLRKRVYNRLKRRKHFSSI
jgi:mRNA-degrading endonuclease RelE of RelBE toxin-antitoxin system